MMERRAFVAGAFALVAAPLAVEAQQARMARVGWLLPDPKPFALDPFRQRLKELGWIEGGAYRITGMRLRIVGLRARPARRACSSPPPGSCGLHVQRVATRSM